jgi:hypothetical protein
MESITKFTVGENALLFDRRVRPRSTLSENLSGRLLGDSLHGSLVDAQLDGHAS